MRPDARNTYRLAIRCDETNAAAIGTILSQIPDELPIVRGERFALLAALSRYDERRRADRPGDSQLAKDLVLASALVHDDVDERRTAEYLLRHRTDVTSGRRSAASLLAAARCGAEMDCLRLRMTEIASNDFELAELYEGATGRVADRSVAETVLAYLDAVTGHAVAAPVLRDQIMTAATIAIEVSERHRLNNGRVPSVIAMRSDAKPSGRLVTHLRAEFGPKPVAGALARILAGPDRSPIQTSLLWWAARGTESASVLPDRLRQRWGRILGDLGTTVTRCPKPVPAIRTRHVRQVGVGESPASQDVTVHIEQARLGPAL
jgi:hypothetical protein